jgi:hypothetical protein
MAPTYYAEADLLHKQNYCIGFACRPRRLCDLTPISPGSMVTNDIQQREERSDHDGDGDNPSVIREGGHSARERKRVMVSDIRARQNERRSRALRKIKRVRHVARGGDPRGQRWQGMRRLDELED